MFSDWWKYLVATRGERLPLWHVVIRMEWVINEPSWINTAAYIRAPNRVQAVIRGITIAQKDVDEDWDKIVVLQVLQVVLSKPGTPEPSQLRGRNTALPRPSS